MSKRKPKQQATALIKPDEISDNADKLIANLLAGLPFRQIERAVLQYIPGKTTQQATLEMVKAKLVQAANLDPVVVKGLCMLMVEDLCSKLVKEGNAVDALKAIKEFNRIANTPINTSVQYTAPEEDTD